MKSFCWCVKPAADPASAGSGGTGEEAISRKEMVSVVPIDKGGCQEAPSWAGVEGVSDFSCNWTSCDVRFDQAGMRPGK